MIIKQIAQLAVAATLLAGSLTVSAHHGQAGLFDQETLVEIQGTVKEWLFVNPHPVLLLEVSGTGSATEEWDVYFGPAAVSFMRRRGFTAETFSIGQQVIVTGHPATSEGARGIDVWGADATVTDADGTPIP